MQKIGEFLLALSQIRMATYIRTISLYFVKRLVHENTVLSYKTEYITSVSK